jgi:ribonuclease BN (tRNA processing enzyme)
MKVQFIGVGEAVDETLPNNSQLLEWSGGRLLIDCGYSIPHALLKLHTDPNLVSAVYISHRHADHYFGLPSYLLRLAEDDRKDDIFVICPEGMEKVIREMCEYAYQGLIPKFGYAIRFSEVSTDTPLDFQGARMEFALSSHPVKNFAISVSADGRRYCYSGDGDFNANTRKLYAGCSMLVHEAYHYDSKEKGHARISEVITMAKEQKCQRLALTHIQREVRKTRRKEIEKLIHASGVRVIVPEPGETYEV